MREVKTTFVPGLEASHSHMARFMRFAAERTGAALHDWPSLYRWSTEHHEEFWRVLLSFTQPLTEGERTPVCVGSEVESARFFPNLRLNYAENLLSSRAPGADQRIALTAFDEAGGLTRLTRRELRHAVRTLASGLAELGLGKDSRVCALARNDASAVTACLATATLGASWASVSADLGVSSVLSRFVPLEPELLFAHTFTRYQGQTKSLLPLVREVLGAVPSIRTVVLLDDGELDGELPVRVVRATELAHEKPEAEFVRVPFDHPLFIMFSSGTTGAPKCIVHGHGGTLLEHLKELVLHTNLSPDDVLCFVTSTGWMMWNWLVSGLATGCEVVLFDGSVAYPEPDALLHGIAARGVSVLGTSPAYLRYLDDAGIVPRERVDLSRLRAVLSTGSILYDDQFDFVARAFGPVPLQSISGGTDILGCFVLGNPLLPVYRGESQCVSLGLDVRAHTGTEALVTGSGELVCVKPFPSRPVGLYADPEGQRFHEAYFAQHEGVWTHGDLLELTERGTARILGRSDGVLNIRGIRIGPAELYGIVSRIDEVAEAMAVDQEAPEVPGGRRLVMLVVLKPGCTLDRPLTFRIKRELKDKASLAHVPDVILQVEALPQTHNGKRSERAVQDLLNGRRPRNLSALKNPEALSALLAFEELAIDPGLLG